MPPSTPSGERSDSTDDSSSPASPVPSSGKPRESGRKSRRKFYAYTTPISPVLPQGEWTELRRFVAADIHVRQQRVRGMELMLPLGASYWSREVAAAALERYEDPRVFGEDNLRRLRSSLSLLDVSVHPLEFVVDHDPAYYRWTQWIFLQLYRRGLVRLASPGVTGRLEGPDDVEDGSFTEAFRDEPQAEDEKLWMLRLTQYGERLINDLGKSNWRAQEKANQRHRLGRLRGCDLLLQVSHYLRTEVDELKVFSSRVETIYGATFILIHPWHPILGAVVEESYEEEVKFYRDRVLRNQEPRLSGVRTGGFAINPATLERIPVLVSRLAMDPECGGTILGVPAHDPLLYQLALRVKLPIREVIRGNGVKRDVRGKLQGPYLGDGNLTNSGPFSGTPTRAARDRIINFLGRRGICRRSTRFFFDWLPVSQRSIWGVPVPMIHCPMCGLRPVPERDLPVVPPHVLPEDLRAVGFGREKPGESPPADLAFFERFVPVSCPECKGRARRDTHVLSDWLGKSWMPLRHAVPELAEDVSGWRVATEESAELEDGAGAFASPEESRSVQNLTSEDIDQLALFGSIDDRGHESPPDRSEDEPAETSEPDDASRGDAPQGSESESPVPVAASKSDDAEAAARGSESAESASSSGELVADLRADGKTSANLAAASSGDSDSATPGESAGGSSPEDAGDSKSGDSHASSGIAADETEGDEEAETEAVPGYPAGDVTRVQPFRKPGVRKWLSVDLGLGTRAGGVMEVLWSRFVTKFLYDLREISFYEPFYRFARVGEVDPVEAVPAGVAAHETGRPTPGVDSEAEPDGDRRPTPEAAGLPPVETLVERYGSDVVRIGLLSRCCISRRTTISHGELMGIRRLLQRVRRNISMRVERGKFVSRRVLVEKHRLIRSVTENIRSLRFHRAIAGLRSFVKFLHRPDIRDEEMDRGSIQMFLVVLFPFAPKLATELWATAGNPEPIEQQGWAEASDELLQSEEIEIPVEFNNRVVLRVNATADLDSNALRELVLADNKVREKLAGRHVDRVIAVPGRVVNLLLEAGC